MAQGSPIPIGQRLRARSVSAGLSTEDAAALDTVEGNTTNRYAGGKTPVVANPTASGVTTVYTPAPGNAVRLFWAYALCDPAEANPPIITISIGALDCYLVYGVAHWEIFEGAADDALVVNLSSAASVACTFHIQEFTP